MANACYCNTCQIVKEYEDLKLSLSDEDICIEKYEGVTTVAHNKVIDTLKAIYNFGEKGSRTMPKPSVVNLQKVQKYSIYTADMYNALLETIDDDEHSIKNTIGAEQQETYIRGYYFKELETYINNVKIDADKCAICNICNSCNGCESDNPCTACESGCQGCQDYNNPCAHGWC